METYIDKVYKMVQKETGLKSKETIKMYTLLALVKGENTTLSDIHDGWSMVMNYKESNPPYCYGHEHKSIVPFDQLSKETQDRDIKYMEAIHKVARELKEETLELKPCPFCGRKVELKKELLWTKNDCGYKDCYEYVIECDNPECGCKINLPKNDTVYHADNIAMNNAIKAWNRRAD